MTVPRGAWASAATRVADMVREFVPALRRNLSEHEQTLSIYLRSNAPLFDALKGVIESRIGIRASSSVPSDPIQCKAMLDRDNELRWLLSRLDFVYRSPLAQSTDDGEQPS